MYSVCVVDEEPKSFKSMESAADAPAADAARPSVAVLLAGQIRSLAEPPVRRELLLNVVRPTGASVLAHLSPEHEYSAWHNFSVGSVARDVTDDARTEALAAALRHDLRPVYLCIEPDEVVRNHPRWRGALLHRPQRWSVLFFRWLLLHGALQAEERRRGAAYTLVFRLRPDLLLTCTLPEPPDVLNWMGAYSALQHGDAALLMRRDAADVALRIYLHANATAPCAVAVEICVPGLLALRGHTVASMKLNTVALVRPEAFCGRPSSARLPEWLSCGRSSLSEGPPTTRPRCTATAARSATQAWNLTAHVQHWRERHFVARARKNVSVGATGVGRNSS